MADIPVHPNERHDWLCGRLGEGKPDYWLVNLIQHSADSLREPSVDIFGCTWTFPSLVGKHAVAGNTPLNSEAFQLILNGMPEQSRDPTSLGWLLAGYAYSEAITRKSNENILGLPGCDRLFDLFQALSPSDQAYALGLFRHAILDQFQTRWQLHSDKTANEWSGRGVIADWLGLRSATAPENIQRMFHQVAAEALLHSAFLYSVTGPTAGQTHALLKPLEMAPFSTDIVDRTVERLMAYRNPSEKPEQTAYRLTMVAALVVATPPSNDAAGLKRLEALKAFRDHEALIRDHLPFIERDNLQMAFDALKERSRAYWAMARAQEWDGQWQTTPPKRSPRM